MNRPILFGYMEFEEYAEDYSEWTGVIVSPPNPRGANLFWKDPIPMIEKRAYDRLKKALERISKECALSAGDDHRAMLAKAVDTADVALLSQQATQEGDK